MFMTNIKGTNYEKIERENDSRIIIKGQFIRIFWEFDPLPLWTGTIRQAELYFTKNGQVNYSLDFTYALSLFTLPLLVFLISVLDYRGEAFPFFAFFTSILILAVISVIIIQLFRHRQIFLKTLRFENRYTGDYDWKSIFKTKTDRELKNIVAGNTTLNKEVQKLAKKELDSRLSNVNVPTVVKAD